MLIRRVACCSFFLLSAPLFPATSESLVKGGSAFEKEQFNLPLLSRVFLQSLQCVLASLLLLRTPCVLFHCSTPCNMASGISPFF